MREEEEFKQVFTPDMIERMIYIWTRSSISLMDVRHQHIDPEHPLERYRMPSSMLVYAYGGAANVQLNETAFSMERFGIFHGGKGTTLSILPDKVRLGSYLAFYKAETPSFFKKDLQRLLEQVNPFVQLYGFAPRNPVGLMNLFQQMMDNWSGLTALNHFQAKNLLYQSIHQIYGDLEMNEAIFLQPDPVISTKRYLDEHFMHPITFQEIADLFAISRGQLTRLFKKREGVSLQEYLTLKRLEAARSSLLNTNATVKEIAPGCGLVDEQHLIRIFRRHYAMTPSEYRNKMTTSMHALGIDSDSQRFYNEKGLEKLAKSQGDGEFTMFGQARSKQMILAAAMSLLLLLSACGTAPANTNGAQTTPTLATTTQSPSAATKAEAAWPRTYVDTTGSEVIIKKQPERVALIFSPDIDWVFSLGVIPVAVADVETTINRRSVMQPLRNVGVADLGNYPTVNLEKLLELKPDLIIGHYRRDEKIWEQLKQIAPVVSISDKLGVSFESKIGKFAEVLGKEKEAEAVIASTKQKTEDARKQLASLDETVLVLTGFEDGKTGGTHGKVANLPFYGTGVMGLGLNAPEGLSDTWQGEVSLEGIAALDPDHIFLTSDSEEFEPIMKMFSESAVWNSLEAVRNNQVHNLNTDIYGDGNDLLQYELFVDYVTEMLLK